MKLQIRRVGNHELPVPSYAHEGDAGMDLRVNLVHDEPRIHAYDERLLYGMVKCDGDKLSLAPKCRYLIPCGFAFEIPEGFEGQLRPRSSMFSRGLHIALGTIDSHYRGEVLIGLLNMTNEWQSVAHGERIAQLVVSSFARCDVLEVEELSSTVRGEGGFGSTGAS
jgi:dUTP pyrophosphatase